MRAPFTMGARAALFGLSLLVAPGCGENLSEPGTAVQAPLACLPDLDGRIDARELTPALGVPANYLVGKERPVALGGEGDWDLSVSLAGDDTVALAARALGAEWYAQSFPTGEFIVPLDARADSAGTLEGIYRHDEHGLWLLGLASVQENPPEGKTLLVYAAAVPVLRFPLMKGARWSAVGDLGAGTVRGLPYIGKDSYEVTVDAEGTVALPAVSFQRALRVRTRVTSATSLGAAIVRRQVGFYFECFGEVARATSRDNESNDDFTTAAELRRLTF